MTLPLAPYSEPYWFPSGAPAAGSLAYVYGRNPPGSPDKELADLFSDQAGTLPMANPVNIGPSGVLSFFVENGDHWVYVNGQSFYVIVDLDAELSQVWPSTFVHQHPVSESVWTVAHGLKSFPAVAVLVGGQLEFADVTYADQDNLTITFAAPRSGTAYLRR